MRPKSCQSCYLCRGGQPQGHHGKSRHLIWSRASYSYRCLEKPSRLDYSTKGRASSTHKAIHRQPKVGDTPSKQQSATRAESEHRKTSLQDNLALCTRGLNHKLLFNIMYCRKQLFLYCNVNQLAKVCRLYFIGLGIVYFLVKFNGQVNNLECTVEKGRV